VVSRVPAEIGLIGAQVNILIPFCLTNMHSYAKMVKQPQKNGYLRIRLIINSPSPSEVGLTGRNDKQVRASRRTRTPPFPSFMKHFNFLNLIPSEKGIEYRVCKACRAVEVG
jgi:hypothetical protein